ncbi:hypothetical protein [Basfia succiniciproducens]|uniref:hypothetical protein n=1 Tax=Basfia succiniciproducens TaxID=653940 RepID=UPI0008D5F4BB|nr:hypothetical protein [Basfia succiniciproducens]SEP76891.1 hypothetical protein SAMN02910415_00421 [Basfia succiniciproducens]
MFYIEKQIPYLDNLQVKYQTYHTISQARIDYINREIEINIASFETFDDLLQGNNRSISGLLFNYKDINRTLPIDYISLYLLTQIEDNVFFGCEVKEINNNIDSDLIKDL